MLQTIHDKFGKTLGWLVIVPLAFTFAVWGVHGLVDFTTRSEKALRVNGQEVSVERLRQAYQEQMVQVHRAYPDEVPAEILDRVKNGLVEQYVSTTLLDQRVADRKFVVGDRDVVDSIQSDPTFQVDGKFNRDAYEAALRAQGLSPERYEVQQREQLKARQLEGGLFLSSFATPKEVEAAAALRGESRELAYAIVPAAKYLQTVKVDDAAVKAYYDAHAAEFVTPETVKLAYVRLTVADAQKDVVVDDDRLKAYYEQVKSRYSTPEKRHARHILIASGNDDAVAKKKIEEIYAEVTKPGADFAAIAKAKSQDPGSAPQGGDLGWTEKGTMVPAFDAELFAMQPGQISKPVKTQFGWHVIKLEGVEAGAQKGFDQVRGELEAEYRRAEAEKAFGDKQEKIDQLAFENSGSLEPVAKALGLEVKTIDGFTKKAGGAPLGANPKLLAAAFSSDVLGGQNSRAIELAPGDVVVVRATDHKPSVQQPLADVRAKAEAGAREQAAEAAAKAIADKLETDVKGGATLEAAVKPLGDVEPADKPAAKPDAIRVQAPKFVTRGEPGIAPEVVAGAFKLPRPAAGQASVGTVAVGQGSWAVYAVRAVKPGAVGTDADPKSLARELARSDILGYVNAMRQKAEVHYNPTVFD
jgi:peptidyl-prolyl cis-trans isomerase D